MFLSKNQIKLISSLQIKKYRDENSLFVVEGVKMVEELYNQDKFVIDHVYFTSDYNLSIPDNIHSTEITNKELERISGLKNPNKILAVVKMNDIDETEIDVDKPVLILDDIKDPGNLGTILRTADWFGIKTVIASEKSVELYNPKVIQSSMGAIFRINFLQGEIKSWIPKFKDHDYQIIGAGLGGTNIYNYEYSDKMVILMGSESHGISNEIKSLLDQELSIPKYGHSESLNVAIATGIFLSEYRRQLG